MIDNILIFIRDRLNDDFNADKSPVEIDAGMPLYSFLDDQNTGAVQFKQNAVSILLVNVEEEHQLRPRHRFQQKQLDGTHRMIHPEIRLHLHVLFVAFFKQYTESLKQLSHLIQFFQQNRVFDQQSVPGLDDKFGRLTVELVTQSFAEQNEVWNALRAPYQPSALYKISFARFYDPDPTTLEAVSETKIGISQQRTQS